jgi:hypothetical protein
MLLFTMATSRGMLPHHYTRCHNPEDRDLNLYRLESPTALQSRLAVSFLFCFDEQLTGTWETP